MSTSAGNISMRSAKDVFLPNHDDAPSVPIYTVTDAQPESDWKDNLSSSSQTWLNAIKFQPKSANHAILPNEDGSLAGVIAGFGDGTSGRPCGPSETCFGKLARKLPVCDYHIANPSDNAAFAALSWGLGAYKYRDYQKIKSDGEGMPRLRLPQGVDFDDIASTVESVWFGRDLINRPASDLGPDELEAACRCLAERHDAEIAVILDDDLLRQNFPLIHAVGRASTRRPRLIDISWTPKGRDASTRKQLTIIGKGVCFDTGGLDLKPAPNMQLMKKDMGGSAAALTLASMIMGQNLNVALRVLIPAVENSVSGNAFRPGDVIKSRSGKTVEVGNTDAEGRLVLADALTYAEEKSTGTMMTFATLTGAARVALGPDLPALFSTDDTLARSISLAGLEIADPVWQMPFWKGYQSMIKSPVADISNMPNSPLAGAIAAALFLKSFVKKTERYVHIDLYGWRPSIDHLGPTGGEPHAARAVFKALAAEVQS